MDRLRLILHDVSDVRDRPDTDTPVRLGLGAVDNIGSLTVSIRKALKAHSGGNTTCPSHRTVSSKQMGWLLLEGRPG